MKILLAGATGVLGRSLLPHLQGQEVLGLTRSPPKLALLEKLGATGAVCDIYDTGAFEAVALSFRPDLVINFLTDLKAGPGFSNTRIRREGGPIVLAGAKACGARGIVVESVAFSLPAEAGQAVAELEQAALSSGLEAWVLRFHRLWGEGTWDAEPPGARAVEVKEAGRLAGELIVTRAPGIYVVDGTGASPGDT